MRKILIAAALILLPMTAHAEYERGLTPRQAAVKNVLLENYTIMDRDAQAVVRDLIAQAETAAQAGKQKEADHLIGKAMMLVAEKMFYMNAQKSDG